MLHARTVLATLCVLFTLGTLESRAQPDHHRTVIVDPSATGFANQPTIQDGIDAVPNDPDERWTVLIYSGVYEEEVTLGDTKENVDLVGVDPDAVIIRPDPSQGDTAGIIIDGVGVRNNTIRNLTIEIPDKTGTGDDLDGILIKKTLSGDDPSGIAIEDVTILVDADDSRAIRADLPVSDLTISGCAIECTAAGTEGVVFDDAAADIAIDNTKISTTGDDGHALLFSGQVTDSSVIDLDIVTTGEDAYGVYLAGGDSTDPNADVAVSGTTITTTGDGGDGVYLEHETERFSLTDSSLILSGHLAVPFNVSGSLGDDTIEDLALTRVTIRHTHQVAAGVQGQPTTGMKILDCDFFMQDAHTIQAGNHTLVANSSIITRDTLDVGGDDNAGVVANDKTGLRIENSVIEGRKYGVQLQNDCTDVRIVASELRGSHYGMFSKCGDDIRVVGCAISGDSARGNDGGIPATPFHGVYIDDNTGCEPGVIRFVNCEIDGRSAVSNHDAMGVYVEAAPGSADGPVVFENCTITAFQEAATGADTARCFGVKADEAGSVALVGGSVSSFDGDEREPDQYDLRCPDGVSAISVSGAEFSKWRGPIGAAVAPVPTVQRTIAVPAASTSAVYGVVALPAVETEVTSGITDPVGYRVLSVTLTQTQGADYTLLVIGTNAAGARITDAITVDQGGTSGVGIKPFDTVTKLIVRAGSGNVSVGTTDELGLEFPIAADSAVQQQGKMASAASSYTIGSPGTVDEDHATVDVATITAGDSFEWAVRASR